MMNNYEFHVITSTYCDDDHCTNRLHQCTFQVATAHFVYHCTLKQALVYLFYGLSCQYELVVCDAPLQWYS